MDIGIFCTVVGTGLSVIGFIYAVIRNFRQDFNKKFESHERRFELIENRMFLLCMGKSLPDILKEEKEAK